MFIKKDLRKLDEILNDSQDRRENLKLSKRSAEFDGSIKALCRETRLNALQNLKDLNLYENDLSNLQGIGLLSRSPIEEINLGYNKIATIPNEFGTLITLRTLWLDDNQLEQFPTCLCQLTGLLSLRLTGNDIESIPISIVALQALETLAVDNNRLTEFPAGCLQMPNLKHLWLRQNKITDLPDNLNSMVALETLSVSSNQLTYLPSCLSEILALQRIYANGNKIETISSSLCTLPNLVELNLANNELAVIPLTWLDVWGAYDEALGVLAKGDNKNDKSAKAAKVTLRGNPLVIATAV